jgi:hypothetical protein
MTFYHGFRFISNQKKRDWMNIQTVIRDAVPYNENSYSNFSKVMENAYIELSFWGSRNVYSVGYSNSISLQELAEKMSSLVKSHPEFSQEERAMGKTIQNKISSLYVISCNQVDRMGLIRSFIFSLIELFTDRSSTLYDVATERPFDYCTAKQYEEISGRIPTSRCVGSYFKEKCDSGEIEFWTYPKIVKETKNDI